MSSRNKNILYSLLLIILLGGVYWYRQSKKLPNVDNFSKLTVQGNTMGTTYTIKYLDKENRDLKKQVDSILVDFNNCLSTYQEDSEISAFNQDKHHVFQRPYFYPVLKRSQEIYQATKGAFDPTVAPLVNAWGFGPKRKENIGKVQVDSLLNYVGFDTYIQFDAKQVEKIKEGVKLDFNAIAQGYSSDVIAQYLEKLGIINYMVEIGGEVMCRGKNEKNQLWSIGIDDPTHAEGGHQNLKAIVKLDHKALATSGNYRNFYEKDGKRYAHTINPKTGFPVEHSLLSATVIAPDAMTADAYATAFMVIGMEEAKKLLQQHGELAVYFIYMDDKNKLKTYISPNLEAYLHEE